MIPEHRARDDSWAPHGVTPKQLQKSYLIYYLSYVACIFLCQLFVQVPYLWKCWLRNVKMTESFKIRCYVQDSKQQFLGPIGMDWSWDLMFARAGAFEAEPSWTHPINNLLFPLSWLKEYSWLFYFIAYEEKDTLFLT